MAVEINGTTGVSLIQDGVVTAADLASGAITASALPAGSILQFKTINDCTQKSISNVNEGYFGYSIALDNDLVSTSSKIIIDTSTYIGYGNNVSHGFFWSSSPTSAIAQGLPSGAYTHYTNQTVYNSNNGPRDGMHGSFRAVIEPSSTTPATYYLWGIVTTNNQTEYLNRAANGRQTPDYNGGDYWAGAPATVITIMEVAQ